MSVMKHFAMSMVCLCVHKSKFKLRPTGKSCGLFPCTKVCMYIFKDSKSRRTAKLHDQLKSYNNFNKILYFITNKKKRSKFTKNVKKGIFVTIITNTFDFKKNK